MHEPVEPNAPATEPLSGSIPCFCACGETGDEDAGQTNYALAQLPVYIDMNGDPSPEGD